MKGALEGIRVIEFSWVVAGPWIGKILADHGAEVIRVESRTHVGLDRTGGPYKDKIIGIERSGTYHFCNENKYGITIDLKNPKGLEIAKRIITQSDVVLESYRPGVMARLGLSYEELSKIKPDIIYISASILGQTGPYSSLAGLGVQLTGLMGLFHITGWPDRGPALPSGTPSDIIAPIFGTIAVVAALDYRRRTGKGKYIDLSQYEASSHFMSPLMLDYVVNGRIANRMGNFCACAAPHGAYPCLGEDRWCAIAVFTDGEWEAFCRVVDDPFLTNDPRFATLQGRKENEAELDKRVASWTTRFSGEYVMTIMQEAGVSAGVVKSSRELYEDPQLEHRHYFWKLKHKEIGDVSYQSPPFKLSKTPARIETPAPCLGENNSYVYTRILGLSHEEFTELVKEGAFQ